MLFTLAKRSRVWPVSLVLSKRTFLLVETVLQGSSLYVLLQRRVLVLMGSGWAQGECCRAPSFSHGSLPAGFPPPTPHHQFPPPRPAGCEPTSQRFL